MVKKNVKLEIGFIEFKNYSRQIPVLFKIYADFECLIKGCDSRINNECFSYTSKYQNHIPCSFAYKIVCVDDNLIMMLCCTEEKMQSINLFSLVLESIVTVEE